MVTDAPAVEAVALGDDGVLAGLSPDGLYLDMSTIDPDVSRRLAAEFASRDRVMLDAPLSGSPVTVRQGTASTIFGGDRVAYVRAAPVLHDIGSKVSYIGPSGTACR